MEKQESDWLIVTVGISPLVHHGYEWCLDASLVPDRLIKLSCCCFELSILFKWLSICSLEEKKEELEQLLSVSNEVGTNKSIEREIDKNINMITKTNFLTLETVWIEGQHKFTHTPCRNLKVEKKYQF